MSDTRVFEVRLYYYPDHKQMTVTTARIVDDQGVGFGSDMRIVGVEPERLSHAVRMGLEEAGHRINRKLCPDGSMMVMLDQDSGGSDGADDYEGRAEGPTPQPTPLRHGGRSAP